MNDIMYILHENNENSIAEQMKQARREREGTTKIKRKRDNWEKSQNSSGQPVYAVMLQPKTNANLNTIAVQRPVNA
jgi:hypothetical protein